MGKNKLGRAVGLSILGVLSMMALFAASAQAGSFYIKNAKSEKVFLLATATGSQEGSGSLLVPGRNLTLTCTSGDVENGHLISSTEGLGVVKFLGCTALNHNTGAELPCTVDNPTATAILLPGLHGSTPYVRAEGDPSKAEKEKGKVPPFTTVLLLGASCPLPEENPVTGSVSAQVTTDDSVVNLVAASAAFSTLVSDSLKFGGFAATITANATIELTGDPKTGGHAGLAFGIG